MAGGVAVNQWVLHAALLERGALRYTPAGLPALDLQLLHESTVVHETQERKVSLQIKALAVGSMVSPVSSLALGATAVFSGFMATSRNGRGLLFHVTAMSA
jgi:primosomal replication protein N